VHGNGQGWRGSASDAPGKASVSAPNVIDSFDRWQFVAGRSPMLNLAGLGRIGKCSSTFEASNYSVDVVFTRRHRRTRRRPL